MAIQSIDQLVAAISAGKIARYDWNKITGGAAYSSGRWYDMATLGGLPVATTYPGAALVAQTFHERTGDGANIFGIPHGGDVSTDLKHLLNMNAWTTAATGVPGTLMLVDYLMAYPGINMNLAATATFTASSSSGLLLTYATDYPTFSRVRFTTTTTLPTGLALATDYWTVRVSATTCRVATSLANAQAGTVIAFTDAGTGTHTLNLQYQTLVNSNTVVASSSSGILLTHAQDFTTFTEVRFTTTGTLPTGLSLATDYWTVRVSATTSRIATSLANAQAGTVIAFTDAGTGTHTMTVQVPRYDDGAGVRMFLEARATTGATAHNIAYTYTDQAGNTGNTNPVTVAATASAIVPHIVHSGTAANNYGPFLPLASGDTGIRSVDGVHITAASGTASTAVLVLVRPLAQVALSVVGLMTEKDLLNQIPSLPRIRDGACLGWIYGTGAATVASSTFSGATECVWG
jgi:hypothetical protein